MEQIEDMANWLEANGFDQLDFDENNVREWAFSGHETDEDCSAELCQCT
jgi:hypothetical protein